MNHPARKAAISTCVAACACLAPRSAAQELLVLPPAYATTPGTTGLNTLLRELPRSCQHVIPGADLEAAAGRVITGYTLRAQVTATNPPLWPAAAATWPSYSVWIGELETPLGQPLNGNFEKNIVAGTKVRVRSGAMTIPAGSFPNTGVAPNPFGAFFVDFNERGFRFDPRRNYVITVRHEGGSGAALFANAVLNSPTYRALSSTSATAETGSSAGYTVHQFRIADVPECYANCDESAGQPALNVADFTCFLRQFADADPYANCDASTAPPVLNVADFTCFLQHFAAGCL